jgi:hypothetical protein
MEALVKRRLLQVTTEVHEWIVPSVEEVPMPPDGYVVTFVPFHERGLVVPHQFFQELLHLYSIELQHLDPNKV